MSERIFTAKGTEVCYVCNLLIPAGSRKSWDRRGKRGDRHFECADVPTPTKTPSTGGLFEQLAKEIGPYIENSIDGLEDQIHEMVQDAVKDALDLIPTQRIEIFSPETKETKTIDGQHQLFATLLKLVTRRKSVYLYGGPGSGKSTAAFAVADALGMQAGYISLSPQASPSVLFGFVDAHGNPVKTEFSRLYTEGGVFCIDEADNANANLLVQLNGALAGKSCAFPWGNEKRHPDFVCIATGNISGWGADRMFPDRRPLDAAFRDRFFFVEWSYDEKFESMLALLESPSAKPWVKWIQSVRSYVVTAYPKLMVTPRASIEGASMLGEFAMAELAEMLVFKGFDRDSKTRILAANPLPEVN